MEEMENDIKEENYKFNKPVGYREEFSEIEDEIYYINNLSNILFIIFFILNILYQSILLI